MKIYKISATALSPAADKAVKEAEGKIMGCIEVLNTNIKVIENNPNVSQILTNREQLITQLKGGQTRNITEVVIQDVLRSMSLILNTIPILHMSLDVLKANNIDINKTFTTVENSLRQGKINPSDAQNIFISNLPASSNLSTPANLSP